MLKEKSLAYSTCLICFSSRDICVHFSEKNGKCLKLRKKARIHIVLDYLISLHFLYFIIYVFGVLHLLVLCERYSGAPVNRAALQYIGNHEHLIKLLLEHLI